MVGYTNPAKMPFDWHVRCSRSAYGRVTMASLQSQLDAADALIGAISERCKDELIVFSKQLKAYGRTVKQTKSDRKARLDVTNNIGNCLSHKFYRCNAVLVGSWASRCGCASSNMDVTLVVQDMAGQVHATKDFMLSTLSRVKTLLMTTGADHFSNVTFAENTQIPHLKFTAVSGTKQFRVRVNVNQLYDITSAHLLKLYAKLDKRIATLCLLVKEWAKTNRLANPNFGTFSGHTLNLLVLHYLMCATLPSVLPNIQQKCGALRGTNAIKMVKNLPRLSTIIRKEGTLTAGESSLTALPNTRSVAYLLMGFYDYYSRFDYANHAISIANGCCVARECLPKMSRRYPIVVMDPYEALNAARNINASSFRKILSALRATRERLFDPSKPPSIRDLGLAASLSESAVARKEVATKDIPTNEIGQKIAVEEQKCANSIVIKDQKSMRKPRGAEHAEKNVTNATANEIDQEQGANLSLNEAKECGGADLRPASTLLPTSLGILPIRAVDEVPGEVTASFNDLGLETVTKSDRDVNQKLGTVSKTVPVADVTSEAMLAQENKSAHDEPKKPDGTEKAIARKKRRQRRRRHTSQLENRTVTEEPRQDI